MTCTRLNQHALIPNKWHTLWCAQCRAAREADAITALGIECMKAQPYPEQGLAKTLGALNLAPTGRRFQLFWLFRRNVARPLAATFGLFTVMSAGWLVYINIDSHMSVFVRPMVGPNGYDDFVGATGAIVGEGKISAEMSPAATGTKASLAITFDTPGVYEWGVKQLQRGDAAAQEKQKQQALKLLRENRDMLVAKNQFALSLVRQGFAFPCRAPFIPTFSSPRPPSGKFQSLARLFVLEADARAERQDWMGAANSGLDAIELGAQIAHGATYIYDSMHCKAIGSKAVWYALGHLSAEQCRVAEQRMEKIRGLRVPFGDILENQKWETVSGLQATLHTPYPMAALSTGHDENVPSLQKVALFLKLLTVSKRQIVARYAEYMDKGIAEARTPDAVRPRQIDPPTDPISANFAPDFEGQRLQAMIDAVQEDFLLTTLALRAYRLDRGEYPKALTDLVPGYMNRLPVDPFATKAVVPHVARQGDQLSYTYPGIPLKYQKRGPSYILYSIGPDCKDDNGATVPDFRIGSNSDQANNYPMDWELSGDIVARKVGN